MIVRWRATKGQIVLPAEIRRQDGIEPGQEFEVERIDRGAPNPAEILSLAFASFADIPAAELGLLTRRLREPES